MEVNRSVVAEEINEGVIEGAVWGVEAAVLVGGNGVSVSLGV